MNATIVEVFESPVLPSCEFEETDDPRIVLVAGVPTCLPRQTAVRLRVAGSKIVNGRSVNNEDTLPWPHVAPPAVGQQVSVEGGWQRFRWPAAK